MQLGALSREHVRIARGDRLSHTAGRNGVFAGIVRRADPAYMIADRLEKQLMSAEASFGLNPAERQRLFAARASGSLGDLFGAGKGNDRQDKAPPSAPPAPKGGDSPVGFLQ